MSTPLLFIIGNDAGRLLAPTALPGFSVRMVPEAETALEELISSDQGSIVLLDFASPKDVGEFLSRSGSLPQPLVPLLLCHRGQLDQAVELANREGVFRILLRDSDQELCLRVLRDAVRQLDLLTSHRRLQARIDQLIAVDSLTGCLKETPLLERLAMELQRSIRYSHYLSLLFCRIDTPDETAPHEDQLCRLADLARSVMREDVDLLARRPDNTFLAVLPETPIWGAGTVAERLRQKVDLQGGRSSEQPPGFTVSIGVTGYAPEVPDWNNTVDNLLRVGTNCLNQAQANGGNGVLLCP